jgi:chemotaxis protein histidine kinase CheA
MLLAVSMGLVVGGQTWAQNATLEYEKAKLVSKFAKYVSWPAEARQRKFIIGVYDDVEKYNYFSSFFENKGVRGKDVVVRLIETYKEAKDVNILYISSTQRNLLTSLDRTINGSHVLVITENNKDLPNTMINISSNEQQSKITFTVNDLNIDDEQLTIPELSYFSDDVNNEEILTVSPTFALETEKAVLQNQLVEQNEALQNQLSKEKASLSQVNKKLNLSEEKSKKYSLSLQKESERLKISQQANTKKSEEIKSKDEKLQDLEKQLQIQETQLSMTKQEWQVSNEDNSKEQEKAVADLTEELKKQKVITNNTVIKLTDITKENKALSSFQMLFYVFALLTLIALLIAFVMWKKAKNAASQLSSQPENENITALPIREQQLIKSENFAALGYIATDITYAVGLSLDDLQTQFEAAGDTKNATTIKPVITLLENFNLIAADQDDTEIQSFDVIAYMQKMMMLYEFEFNQSDIAYNYSGEKALTIKSVPSYIALVLIHVINNSLKHGFDNKGKGKIALKVEKGAKGGAKITYSDDGKGMSKTILEQVFKPFFTTQSARGYIGIGMSTTYDLINKKLTGDIKIDSKEGKGTTVTITLP